MTHSRVKTEITNGIATVTMTRADKLNALDLEMLQGLVAASKQIRKDRNIRAVILHGDGEAFCAGLDFPSVTKNPWKLLPTVFKFGKKTNLFQEIAWCWRKLPIPVIAVIHGHCYGGGLQLALGADFRFATPDCKFSIMEAKWGLIPDMSASVTLRELISIDLAKELTMTGRVFSGADAEKYGLITRTATDPMDEAKKLIEEIITRSPDSVSMSKRLFHSTWNASVRCAFAIETWLQLKLLLGKNQRIALQSNFKKIPPKFLPRQK